MRGDAVFGDIIHLPRAELQLDALLARPHHGGVDRAIIILLRRRDVILEATGHDRPGRVHDAERLIALVYGLEHHAEAVDVGELFETHRLAFHLAPDRVGALATAMHLGAQPAV